MGEDEVGDGCERVFLFHAAIHSLLQYNVACTALTSNPLLYIHFLDNSLSLLLSLSLSSVVSKLIDFQDKVIVMF